jgi:DNA-binding CsgD family transcriptional regulator
VKADYVSIIEAAYRLDLAEVEWLRGIADAALTCVDDGLGVVVYTFDASDPAAFRPGRLVAAGTSKSIDFTHMLATTPDLGEEIVRKLYLPSPPALLLSECLGPAAVTPSTAPEPIRRNMLEQGIADTIGIRGIDPSGKGVMVGVPLSSARRLAPRRRRVLAQIAAHLAAGWRLRHGLERDTSPLEQADGVLDARGNVEHLRDVDASREDLHALRAAAQRISRSRRLRSSDPRRSVALWEALVAGRWSLVEHFERDGRRYLLVKRNDPNITDPRALTLRERQVVTYARLGHSNKLIAYELGLAPSTVSQQLRSGLAKLGLGSRVALVQLFGAGPSGDGTRPNGEEPDVEAG